MTSVDERHLNQVQLSRRWSLSPRTLERWRWLKQGPDFIKAGGRVIYTIDAIKTFEAAHSTVCRQPPSGGAS
jgi:hypothetical protein